MAASSSSPIRPEELFLNLTRVPSYESRIADSLSPRTPSTSRSHPSQTPRSIELSSPDRSQSSSTEEPVKIPRERVRRCSSGEITPIMKLVLTSLEFETSSSSVSEGQINYNPLWNKGKKNKGPFSSTLNIIILSGIEGEKFNTALKMYLTNKMNTSGLIKPNKTTIELEIRKYLRQEIENILFKSCDDKQLKHISRHDISKVITKTKNDLLSCGAVLNYIHKRLTFLDQCIDKLQTITGKSSPYAQSLKEKLHTLLNWRLMGSQEERVNYRSIEKYLNTLNEQTDLTKFLIETVFKSESHFKDLIRYLEFIFKNSQKSLKPILKSMVIRRNHIQGKSVDTTTMSWTEEKFMPKLWIQTDSDDNYLRRILPESIIRTFIPGREALIKRIRINGDDFDSVLNPDSPHSFQKQYLFILISKLLTGSKESYDEEKILLQIDYIFNFIGIDWNSIVALWNEEVPEIGKILQLDKVLNHSEFPWDYFIQELTREGVPNSFQDFQKIYYSFCNTAWLDVLRLCTINCYGHADRLFRTSYPALYSIPFLTKEIPETFELDISYEDRFTYGVSQVRKMAIYLRDEPSDPLCKNPSGDPLAILTLSWTVSPQKVPILGTTKYVGMLAPKKVEFSSQSTLDEREMILSSLLELKLCPPISDSSI